MRDHVELPDYLAVVVKRWVLVVSILVLTAGVAGGVAWLTPPTYEAQAQLFVSTSSGPENNQQLLQGGTFSADRVKSYALLATSPQVLDKVITDLGLNRLAGGLSGEIEARAPVDTVLINIAVRDRSAAVAAAIANSVGSKLAELIQQLETPLSGGASPVRATVVRQAAAPGQPVAPDQTLYLTVGVLAGLLLGIGVAVLVENLDTSVKTAADIAKVTELAVLATVVRDGSAAKDPIIRGDGRSSRGEAYRQLRTNIQFASVDETPRTIVVTSALAGEGKSSVAGNLAMTLSQVGQRVCLVDGDLRRPSVADYFGLVGEAGLTTVLIGRAQLADVLQPVAPGLVAITSGTIPPNPSELLASERATELLRELEDQYDVVIIDAPPTLPVADAAVLANSADAVLFVARFGKTSKHQLEVAVRGLQQVNARILGVVLNMAPSKGARGNYYGYGHSYSYQSDKSHKSHKSQKSDTAPRADGREARKGGAGTITPTTGRGNGDPIDAVEAFDVSATRPTAAVSPSAPWFATDSGRPNPRPQSIGRQAGE